MKCKPAATPSWTPPIAGCGRSSKSARVVLTTIISATGTRAIADVGLKGLGNEFGLPEVQGHPEADGA